MVPSEEAPLDILAGLFSDMSAYTLPGNTQLSNESLAVAFEALENQIIAFYLINEQQRHGVLGIEFMLIS